MPRPITIAMALSVLIHVALLAAMDWLLGYKAQPSISSTMLVVNFQPHQTEDGNLAEEKLSGTAAGSDSVSPEHNRKTIEDHRDRGQQTAHVAKSVLPAVISPETPAPAALKASSSVQAASDTRVADVLTDVAVGEEAALPRSDVVVATAAIEPVVITGSPRIRRFVVAQTELSPGQEKMLNRKVKQWTENLHSMPELASGLTWKHKGQEYLATFTELPADDEMGIQRVMVEVSTEAGGKRLSTEVLMKRLAFSNYAQFVNRWDPYVQVHNDELEGRFHSNSEISLTYDREVKPVFHGRVTTSSRGVNITASRGYTRRDQIFQGGLQTGVRSIRLPKHFLPFPEDTDVTEDRVHHFGEDTRITFNADGSYDWQPIGSESPPRMALISDSTTYLIADRKVKLHVKGTVNGKVLVYSPERIVIENDLLYEQNPEETPAADDYLGLVSDKYVDIAPPEVTGPGDLLINAAIYAKRRFAVRGYRARENALLFLYGSLSVGSLSATEPRYYTRIRFDRRLEKLRPPGFPMTDRYEVESWDPNWSVEPIG